MNNMEIINVDDNANIILNEIEVVCEKYAVQEDILKELSALNSGGETPTVEISDDDSDIVEIIDIGNEETTIEKTSKLLTSTDSNEEVIIEDEMKINLSDSEIIIEQQHDPLKDIQNTHSNCQIKSNKKLIDLTLQSSSDNQITSGFNQIASATIVFMCYSCSAVFTDILSLNKHNLDYHASLGADISICSFENISTRTQKSVEKSQLFQVVDKQNSLFSVSSPIFKCDICLMKFSQKYLYESHNCTVRKSTVIDVGNCKFQQKSIFKRHKNCSEQSSASNTREYSQSSQERNRFGKFNCQGPTSATKCTVCDRKFSSGWECKLHKVAMGHGTIQNKTK